MRRRNKPLRRQPGRREERKAYLICSEGENTETLYFKGLRRELRAGTVRIEVFSGKGQPYGVVQKALTEAERAAAGGEPYDEVWCVFDVEAPDPHAQLDAALGLAKQHRIHCAVSNPCFEVWLLLHFENLPHLTTDEACRRLERHPCGYRRRDKGLNFEALRLGRAEAIRRASQLDRQQVGRSLPERNPSTSVPLLVTALESDAGPAARAASKD
ncbi:RloB family protein [Micromonospora sp. NPDC049903]|uniref:RloB family protein n=1 Tax=Micromonospora sp. NPDC049903 TaxID=3364276 RepID=UPI0037B0EB7B